MTVISEINLKAYFNKGGEEHDFHGKRCVLAISVGQDYHEDQRLYSAIHLLNESGFSHCKVVVADTLQRHNVDASSTAEALALSQQAGHKWLERNAAAIAGLKMDVQITRWIEELSDPKYSEWRRKVEHKLHESEGFRGAIDSTIDVFIERLKLRDPDADIEAAAAKCREYIIEEIPIIMPLWAEQGYDYVIYPQKMTDAMAASRSHFVEPFLPERVRWLPLKFKKRGQPIPFGGGTLNPAFQRPVNSTSVIRGLAV